MPPRPEQLVRLQAGDLTLTIDLGSGARAVSWTVAGTEVLAHYGDHPVEHGMYPMAPWAGRLRGNVVSWAGASHPLPVTRDAWALHGTALDQPATVSAREDGLLVARIDAHPAWPWPMAVDVAWDLRSGELVTTITVTALDAPFPVVTGWHPWFRRVVDGSPAEWTLAADAMLERGDDHLPTGRLVPFDPQAGPFDDAFRVPDGRATIAWPGSLAVEVESDHPWFVVFDQLPDCLCLEPQSGPPDGLRLGPAGAPAVAAPGRPHVQRTTWRVRDLSA